MVTEQNQLTLLRENLLLQPGHTLIIAASRYGQNELGGDSRITPVRFKPRGSAAEPDDAYLLGQDPRSGLKVAISQTYAAQLLLAQLFR